MALCGAVAATSAQSSVRMWSWNHKRWDNDVNGFNRTEFSQIFRMILTIFQDDISDVGRMPVQSEITLEKIETRRRTTY